MQTVVVEITPEFLASVFEDELEQINETRRELGFGTPLTAAQLTGDDAFLCEAVKIGDPYSWTLLPLILQYFDGLTSRQAGKKAAGVTPACPEIVRAA